MDTDALSSRCLLRHDDALFSLDHERRRVLEDLCADKVVLVTGAAGYIARATLEHILEAAPRIVYLLDSSENGLADLARQLAIRTGSATKVDVRMRLVDITSSLLRLCVDSNVPIDVAFHFAAAKHVRSERDVASALRMLAVNILGTENLLHAVSARNGKNARVFAVSTDKAANPTSLMGASKLAMEALLWQYPGEATSARFANVLFSRGSLTEAWLSRLTRGEPLSSPVGAYRYFISRREAGALCASALTAEPGTVAIPAPGTLTPVGMEDLVERFLFQHELSAQKVTLSDYEASPESVQRISRTPGQYPVVLTPLDTVGEKVQESFMASGEIAEPWTTDLELVPGTFMRLQGLIRELRRWVDQPDQEQSLNGIRGCLHHVLPSFNSNEAAGTLDDRI